MILSHRHRFIFVAVPRTGSQSVRAALRPHLGPRDEEQALWRTQRRLQNPALAAIRHGHITAREAMAELDPELWEGYLTFGFVRDPWERFLSAAALVLGPDPLLQERPVAALQLLIQRDDLLGRVHFRPQADFLTDGQGRLAVDVVGKVERYAMDFTTVMDQVGLRKATLPRIHRSPPAAREGWRDEVLEGWVAQRFAVDYELFGYARPG